MLITSGSLRVKARGFNNNLPQQGWLDGKGMKNFKSQCSLPLRFIWLQELYQERKKYLAFCYLQYNQKYPRKS